MIDIKVTIGTKENKINIKGNGERVLLDDVVNSIRLGTPDLNEKDDTEILVQLIDNLLKGFVRQKANLW